MSNVPAKLVLFYEIPESVVFFFSTLGRFLYVHSADARYCADPCLLVEPADGI